MPTKTTPENIHERFWGKVDVRGADDCWLWQATTTNPPRGRSYGRFRYEQRMAMAHHVALFLSGRTIPEGMEVLHTCDTPLCVNPAHLTVGTRRANMADMVRKGRQGGKIRPGEMHGMAKLTESEVRAIRHLCSDSPLTQAEIAERFGVSPALISFIHTRTIWKHVD